MLLSSATKNRARDVSGPDDLARALRLVLGERVRMPANNLSLIFPHEG
jgi:hypothetical protein